MAITVYSALWFLPFALPFCLWAALSDLKFMKIRNKAVLGLGAVFLVVGLIALPFSEYQWRLLHIVVVLIIGFALNMAGMIGAGDAKFAAAMAPFVPLEDMRLYLVLFAAIILAAFVTHRIFRAFPAIRPGTEDWVSWTSRKFPMGLALGGSLVFYLALATTYGMPTP
jgi:prepilin peptidase CpaA